MNPQTRAALRAQLRASLATKVEAAKQPPGDTGPPPRYDEAFWAFTAWLDSESEAEPPPLGPIPVALEGVPEADFHLETDEIEF